MVWYGIIIGTCMWLVVYGPGWEHPLLFHSRALFATPRHTVLRQPPPIPCHALPCHTVALPYSTLLILYLPTYIHTYNSLSLLYCAVRLYLGTSVHTEAGRENATVLPQSRLQARPCQIPYENTIYVYMFVYIIMLLTVNTKFHTRVHAFTFRHFMLQRQHN